MARSVDSADATATGSATGDAVGSPNGAGTAAGSGSGSSMRCCGIDTGRNGRGPETTV